MNKQLKIDRARLLGAVSALAIAAHASGAYAQAQASNQAAAAEVEEVVVTGSRLTSGFETPTPVTVLSAEQLNAGGAPNIADVLGGLPVFKGSPNSSQPSGGSPNGTNGQNLLNLRGLGTQRNLVLLNGQRVIATNAAGSVDINMLPQGLVRSVEVVTGGASSAYGSDAVSGVVNFILDTHFVGTKADVQGGVSTLGDSKSYKVDFTWGGAFANDRLHVISSFEGFYEDPIDFFTGGGRDWLQKPAGIIPNATAGATPKQLILQNVLASNATYGGLITAGPLKGTEFLPGGVPAQHDYGTYLSGVWQVGGDGIIPRQPQSPMQKRVTGFLHGEYDITDTLTVNADMLFGWTNNRLEAYPNYMYGQFGFTIFSDNAFLPASIKAAMAANKITSFALGRDMKDQHLQEVNPYQKLQRYQVGAKQQLWDNWTLSGYYTHAISNQNTYVNYMPILRNYYAAADAVLNPATGQIVCRSTLAGLDKGCVPLNLFGEGSVSQAASNYVLGSSDRWLQLSEDVLEASLAGNLPEGMSPNAGPISFATGVSYRREGSNQTSDAISQSTTSFAGIQGGPSALNNRPGGFLTFNPLPLTGSYHVSEGFVEFGIPLLKGYTGAQSLDVNLAGRLADYSNSGSATSWKAGLTWRPLSDVLLRFSDSRDVRAPNIQELFNPRSTNAANVIYKGVTTAYTGFTVGNPALLPETAYTTTGGIVYTPSFFPGLSLSVDPFNIRISGAIDQLGGQNIVDQCAAGSQVACNLIQVNGNALIITNPSLNLTRLNVQGIDFEASFDTELLGGKLTMRALANYLGKYTSQSPGAAPISSVDARSSRTPWAGSLQATWTDNPVSFTLLERYIGAAKYAAVFVDGVDINDNTVKPIYYTDFTFRYTLPVGDGAAQLFFTINNLLDKDPPAVPGPSTFQQPTNSALYDVRGRYFTTGIHYKY